MKKRFTLCMDWRLFNAIEELRGGRSRSGYIERLLFAAISEGVKIPGEDKKEELVGYV